MNPAVLVLLRYLIRRRWPLHLSLFAVYGFAVGGTALGLPVPLMYSLAAIAGMLRVDEGAMLTARSVRLLPLSTRDLRLLLWAWVFMTPLLTMGLCLLTTWAASGFAFDVALRRSVLVATYVIAPFALTLLASSLPRTRANGATRLILVLAYYMAVVGDLTHARSSASLLAITIALIVSGLTYPLWGTFLNHVRLRREYRNEGAPGLSWPTGVTALVWSRVRCAIPSILVAGAFVLVLLATSKSDRISSPDLLAMLAIVLMGYIWISNWRWLCHFRALRCLPLSSRQLTALAIGVSFVPAATVWLAQLVVTLWLYDSAALPMTALLALLAVQAITVPVFLYSPDWLRRGTPAAVLPTVFLVLQSVAVVALGWMVSQPRALFAAFIAALVICVVIAVAWTYREITQGRHAYRIQTDDWAPPSWVWVD